MLIKAEIDKIENSFLKLKEYCSRENMMGWDPFDGLNSRIFKASPLNSSRYMRLAWIQFFKKSPINFRKLAAVPKGYNPKAMALFLSGYCNLYRIEPKTEYLEKINFLIEKITELQSPGWSGSCWGYNFDWQARAFFHPINTPTVVSTTFVAAALLDAYSLLKKENLLLMARSSCDFVMKDLNRTKNPDGTFAFSYSPLDQSQIINASLLGVKLLSRVYFYTGEKLLLDTALLAAKNCVNQQKADGSWVYGTLPHHQFIDSFHTGYNLESLAEFQKYTGNNSFEENIASGTKYYLENFFTAEGISKYYNNAVFPVDIHAPAQLIATLSRLHLLIREEQLVKKVLLWTIDHMQHKEKGYFYYQKNKWFTNRIPYMRWSQAWMFYAFSFFKLEYSQKHNDKKNPDHFEDNTVRNL